MDLECSESVIQTLYQKKERLEQKKISSLQQQKKKTT